MHRRTTKRERGGGMVSLPGWLFFWIWATNNHRIVTNPSFHTFERSKKPVQLSPKIYLSKDSILEILHNHRLLVWAIYSQSQIISVDLEIKCNDFHPRQLYHSFQFQSHVCKLQIWCFHYRGDGPWGDISSTLDTGKHGTQGPCYTRIEGIIDVHFRGNIHRSGLSIIVVDDQVPWLWTPSKYEDSEGTLGEDR